jgi:isoquinoline 1-oxidoreductase beta subunit
MSESADRMSRRSLLRLVPLAAAGLALGCFDGKEPALPPASTAGANKAEAVAADFRPNVFVHLQPDGIVNIVCHRSEMGQGVRSTLPVLIADELGADMAKVRIVQGDGNKAYGDQNTDGSSSIREIYDELRRIGATARVMLVAAAAQRWKVAASECVARDHVVIHTPTQRELAFGDLAADAARLSVPEKVELRPLGELPRVFKPLPLVDGLAYVTGTAAFGADVKLPGMLVAVIARPPVVGGKVATHDAARALQVKGVRKVVLLPEPKAPWGFQPLGGVAVIADHTWAAMKGREALAITWDHGPNAVYDSATYRDELAKTVQKPGRVLRKTGDVEAALKTAAKVVEADYHVPHLPHLSMEPPAALARVEGDTCEIWAPTQNPQGVQKSVAEALGTTEEKVTVHVTFLGGGFGRKSKADFCVEAALLARELKAPVRVQWTREDDVRHDYLNTVATNRLTAGLDEKGRVVAWRHRTAFPPIATLFGGESVPSPGDLQQGVLDLALDVPNVSAEAGEAKAYTRIGWLRAVYNLFQAFSVGSFVDEIAHARGTDPRDTWFEILGPSRKASLAELGVTEMKNYGQSLEQHPVDVGRLRGVIERVTKAARWDERKQDGRFLGLAAHRSFLSYAAAVASVVQTPDGRIAVDEVWLAFDAGTVVNPDRVRAQMEGATIFGMTLALHGGITFKGGAVEQSNFLDGGRVVRMNEAPRLTHVELVESDAAPGGVGEPGVPPVAPAITNAIFAMTGKRVRELPLSKSLKV